MPHFVIVLLVATFGTQLAYTQNRPLSGIESLSILVEDLDEDNAGCGLTDDVIHSAVADTFRESGLAVSDVSDPVVAYVRIATTVGENSEECASDYEINLMARVEVAPPFAAESVAGLLSLKNEAGRVSSARAEHSARVITGLSDLASSLARGFYLESESTTATTGQLPATRQEEDSAYRIARCRELLSSPRLVPLETRLRDLDELQCQQLVIVP